MSDLKKCSKCQCMKLLSLFSIRENTGIMLKTCIKCRSKFSCDKCEYKSSTISNLNKHNKAVHDKIKNFNCDKCEFKFSNNIHLKQHIKAVHDKIKDFQCDKCEFKFSTNGNLKQHIKQVHDKIKNFQCDKCEFKSSSNSDLIRHIKSVHDKIKNFNCDKCEFKCCSTGNLKKHIKAVHDKIKDFQCDKCEYKCSDNSSLTTHLKICTGLLNMSAGEFKIIEKLKELKLYKDIDYYHDSTCSELTNYSKRNLRFDFKFINHEIVIEFDGIQHFKPQRFGGISEEKALNIFNYLQITDNFKNKFCIDNNIKMIRISYIDFDKIESILHNELINITNLD